MIIYRVNGLWSYDFRCQNKRYRKRGFKTKNCFSGLNDHQFPKEMYSYIVL